MCFIIFIKSFVLFFFHHIFHFFFRDTRRALRQKYFSDISFNVLLTTDSFIMKDCTYLRKIHWEYLIVDEAHRYA
jgi:SNF2 family DNA or RNA helicase